MIKIVAFTCYTGGKSYLRMTRNACAGVSDGFHWAGVDGTISICDQGADRLNLSIFRCKIKQVSLPVNRGFAVGMNSALKRVKDEWFDYYICFNNDIDFSQNGKWLKELLYEAAPGKVLVPTTTVTACARQKRSQRWEKDSFDVPSTPAVLWMFPNGIFKRLTEKGKLFPEGLGRAWGEDTVVTARLHRMLGPEPFRVVPRAWVHHIGEKTSLTIPVKERMEAVRRARKMIKDENRNSS